MEGTSHAINKRTGSAALAEYSIKNIEGIGRQEYTCLECEQKLILKKGDINKAHFAHEAQDKECSYYSKNLADAPGAKIKHAERIHQIAIQELKRLLEEDYNINPTRRCSALKDCANYTTEVVELEHNHRKTVYKTEYPIIHEGRKRIADLVRIDESELKYIFEILDCNRTNENSRPTDCEWFEFYADDIIKIRTKLDNGEYKMTDGIELDCQRLIFKCRECFESEKAKLERETKIIEEQRKKAELVKKEKERILSELQKKAKMDNERKKIMELEIKERQRIIAQERQERDRIIELEQKKQKELQKLAEKQRMKERAIYQKQLEEERQKAETKRKQELEKKERKCKGCNINYCKCKMPDLINRNNYIMCITCAKRKCECQHITTFFGRGIATTP